MRKILIADDNMVSAMELEEYFEERGCCVTGLATSGNELLDMARSHAPDMILVEIMLPGKTDAVSIAEKLRTEIDIAVIFLVGDAPQLLIKKATDFSSYGLIRKPFQCEQVGAALSSTARL
jgi:two-component system, response regulator PdtaR